MVDIRPFRGFEYNPRLFPNLSSVIAPPYDIISPDMRRALLTGSAYNIANLTTPEFGADGVPSSDFYASSKAKWDLWRQDGTFVETERPSIWRVDETYWSQEGVKLTRIGFIALIKLTEYSPWGIMPHERTHSEPKADRMKLLRTTRANFSPVFLVYHDEDRITDSLIESFRGLSPRRAVLNHDGEVELKVSRTIDQEWIRQFVTLVSKAPTLIADGHHRYESALLLHHDCKVDPSLNSGWVLCYLVSSSSEGLLILPTHRGIHALRSADQEKLEHGLSKFFDSLPSEATSRDLPTLRFHTKVCRAITLRLKTGTWAWLQQTVTPSSQASLDAVVFEEIVLKNILGFTALQIAQQKNLAYFHHKDECLKELERGNLQYVFILRPVPVTLLLKIVTEGGILPQKSTFFYPKCPAGLVIQSLETS